MLSLQRIFGPLRGPIPTSYLDDNFTALANLVVDSIAELRTLTIAAAGAAFALGYYAPGDMGGGAYYYDPADTTSADNGGTIIVANDGGRWKLSYQTMVAAGQFGAVGNGTTDDWPSVSTLLGLGVDAYFPAGHVYGVTQPLPYVVGTRVFGGGTWSGVATINATTNTTTFKYIGSAVVNDLMHLSLGAYGVQSNVNLQNIALTDVVIDCNNGLVRKGVYMDRAWSMNQLERILVIGSLEDGFWAAACFNGSPRDWIARENRRNGITLGNNEFNFAAGAAVDESACINFFGYFNGCDLTGAPLSQFSEPAAIASGTAVGTTATITTSTNHNLVNGQTVTLFNAIPTAYNGTYTVTVTGATTFTYVAGGAPGGVMTTIGGYDDGHQVVEYGIGVFDSRGLTLIDAQAADCSGPGIVCGGSLQHPEFIGGYCEGNGRSVNATRQWAIWFRGASTGGSLFVRFAGMHLGLVPAIRLTGTQPSRVEGAPAFENMEILGTIVSDWGNFREPNSDRNVVHVGTPPRWFFMQLNGDRGLFSSGNCGFDGTGGSIASLDMHGVISAVAYVSPGIADVTISEVYSGAKYKIKLSGQGQGLRWWLNKTSSGFRIVNTDLTGTPTNTNFIVSAEVTADYTT